MKHIKNCFAFCMMKKLLGLTSVIVTFVVTYIVAQFGVAKLCHVTGCGYTAEGVISDWGFAAIYSISSLVIYLVVTILERRMFHMKQPIMHSIKGFNPTAILVGVIVIIALSISLSPLDACLPQDSREFPSGGWTLITIVFVAPIFEEVIFRGRLFNMFNNLGSVPMSALLSSLLFAVIHGEPIVMINGFLVGLLLSYFYLRQHSIFAPIILHVCNNMLAYALGVLSYRGESFMNIIESRGWSIAIYLISVVIVVLSLVVIFRTLILEQRQYRRILDVSAVRSRFTK